MPTYTASLVSAMIVAGRSSNAAKVLLLSPLNGPCTAQSWPFKHSAAALNDFGGCGFFVELWEKLNIFETEWAGFPACRKVMLSPEPPRGTTRVIGPSARCWLSPGASKYQPHNRDASPTDSNGTATRVPVSPGAPSYCSGFCTTLPDTRSPGRACAGITTPTSLFAVVMGGWTGVMGCICSVFCFWPAVLRADSRCCMTSS